MIINETHGMGKDIQDLKQQIAALTSVVGQELGVDLEDKATKAASKAIANSIDKAKKSVKDTDIPVTVTVDDRATETLKNINQQKAEIGKKTTVAQVKVKVDKEKELEQLTARLHELEKKKAEVSTSVEEKRVANIDNRITELETKLVRLKRERDVKISNVVKNKIGGEDKDISNYRPPHVIEEDINSHRRQIVLRSAEIQSAYNRNYRNKADRLLAKNNEDEEAIKRLQNELEVSTKASEEYWDAVAKLTMEKSNGVKRVVEKIFETLGELDALYQLKGQELDPKIKSKAEANSLIFGNKEDANRKFQKGKTTGQNFKAVKVSEIDAVDAIQNEINSVKSKIVNKKLDELNIKIKTKFIFVPSDYNEIYGELEELEKMQKEIGGNTAPIMQLFGDISDKAAEWENIPNLEETLLSINPKEERAIIAFMKELKNSMGEAYDNAEAFSKAMELLGKIKSGDKDSLSGVFVNKNKAENKMLAALSDMPVNNQAARDAALQKLIQDNIELKRVHDEASNAARRQADAEAEITKHQNEISATKKYNLMYQAAPDNFRGILEDLDASITMDDLSFEKAVERLIAKAKELGYAFDEVSQEWKEIESSAGTEDQIEKTNKSFKEIIDVSKIKQGSNELNAALREAMEHLVEMYNAGDKESEEYYGYLYRIVQLQKEMWKFNGGNGSGYDNIKESVKQKGDKKTTAKMNLQDSIMADFMQFSNIDKKVADQVMQIFADNKYGNKAASSISMFDEGKLISAQRFLEIFRMTIPETREAAQEQRNLGEAHGEAARAARDHADAEEQVVQTERSVQAHRVEGSGRELPPAEELNGLVSVTSNVDKLGQELQETGQQGETAGEHIAEGMQEARNEVKYFLSESGELLTFFRGVSQLAQPEKYPINKFGRFYSTNPDVAKEYAENDGPNGQIIKAYAKKGNLLTIDAGGKEYNQLSYLGDKSSEASQEIHKLYERYKELLQLLQIDPNSPLINYLNNPQDFSNIENGIELFNELREIIEKIKTINLDENSLFALSIPMYEKDSLEDLDKDNPFNNNPDRMLRKAGNNGYNQLYIKNVIDVWSEAGPIIGNTLAVLSEDLISTGAEFDKLSQKAEGTSASLRGSFEQNNFVEDQNGQLSLPIQMERAAEEVRESTNQITSDIREMEGVIEGEQLNLFDQPVKNTIAEAAEESTTAMDKAADQATELQAAADKAFKVDTGQTPQNEFHRQIAEIARQQMMAALEQRKASQQAAEGYKEETQAAKEAAKEKQKVVDASKELAKSGEETKEGTKEAAEGLHEEATAAKEAVEHKKKAAKANEELAATGSGTRKGAEQAAEGLREEAEAAEKLGSAWVRSQRGDADSDNYSFVTAENPIEDTRHTIVDGVETTERLVNYDKLAREIIKLDNEIFEIEQKIAHARDTSTTAGMQDRLALLEHDRRDMQQILDDMQKDDAYEANKGQVDILQNQRERAKLERESIQRDNDALEISQARVAAEREMNAEFDRRARNAAASIEKDTKALQDSTIIENDKHNRSMDLDDYYNDLAGMGLLTDDIKERFANLRTMLSSVFDKKDLSVYDSELKTLKRDLQDSVDTFNKDWDDAIKENKSRSKTSKGPDDLTERKAALEELLRIQAKLAKEDGSTETSKVLKQEQAVQRDIVQEKNRILQAAGRQTEIEQQNLEIQRKYRQQLQEQVAARKDKKNKEQNSADIAEATKHNKEAAAAYKELTNSATTYYELRARFETGDNLGYRQEEFDQLNQKWHDATLGLNEYMIKQEGLPSSIDKATEAQQKFVNEATKLAGLSYNEDFSKKSKTLETMLRTGSWTSEYANALEDLKRRIDEINEHPIDLNSEETRAEIVQLSKEFENLAGQKGLGRVKAAADVSLEKIREKIERIMADNTAMGSDLKEKFNDLKIKIDTAESVQDVARLSAQVSKLKTEIDRTGGGPSFADTIRQRLTGVNAQLVAQLLSWHDIIRYIRTAGQAVRELNTAYTEMLKVSNESAYVLKQYQAGTFDVAKEVGTTALALTNSTADWMRLGETLTEAAQSAKDATILLNVSEFQSIDEATQALVSASQAYKELNKMEIIDVLNNIGNNFSISTDQLATGLQNAAAVLKTQGNDLYKAVALLTAGNAITQDISKVAAGTRTIALRLAGTEEAKGELIELGEDVDDFIVDTHAKMQQLIKDYTAVKSNAFKGVDILDSKGNLRDTYDILLDIAKVYQEIVETDKQTGTNRAQALVEAIAGKNRSNIAASILLNPDLLERVYETAQNSQDSAQRELEKYLNSIDGAIARFQNALQEFQYHLLDDSVYDFIELGTKAIEVIDTITSKLGSLPTVIGAVVGAIGSIKNLGIWSNQNGSIGLNRSGIGSIFANMFDAVTIRRQIRANLTPDVLSDLTNEINNAMANGTYSKQMFDGSFINFDNFINSSQIKDELDEIIDAEMQVGRAGQVSQQQVREAFTKTNKHLGAFKSALASIGSTLLNIGASIVIGFAVSELLKIIDNIVHRVEYAKEALENTKSEISSINSTLKENIELLSTAKERYYELSEGVDKFGHNISLSEDQYREFVELNRQLAEKFPELITGYNSSGDAIVYIGDSAEAAAEKLQKMADQQERLANIKIANTLPTSLKDSLTLYSADRAEIQGFEEFEQWYNAKFTNIQENQSAFNAEGHGRATKLVQNLLSNIPFIGDTISDAFYAEHSYDLVQDFKAAYNDFLDTISDETRKQQFKDAIDVDDSLLFSVFSGNLSNIEFTEQEASDFVDAYTRVLNSALAGFNSQKDELYNEIEKTWHDVAIPGIEAQMKLLPSYDALSDNGKELASTLLHNLSSSIIKEMDSSGDNVFSQTEAISWITKNLLEPISEIGEYKSLNIMTKILDFDQKTADKNSLEYVNYVNDLIAEIQSVADLDENKIKLLLGIDIDKSVKDIPGDLDSQITKNMQKNNASLFDPAIIGMTDKTKVAKWGEQEWKYYKRIFGDVYNSKEFEDHSVDSLNKAAAEAVKQTIARYEGTGFTDEFTKLFSKRTNREGAKTGSFDDAITKELKAQNDEIAQLNTELDTLAEERKIKEAELLGYETNLEQNKSSIQSAKDEVQDIDEQLTALEEARLEIQSTQDAIVTDREDYNKRLEAARGNVVKAEARVAAAQLGQTEFEGLQSQKSANAEAIAQAEEDVARLEELNNKLALLRKEEAEGQVVPVDTEAMRIRDEAQAELDSIHEEQESVIKAKEEYHAAWIAEDEEFEAKKAELAADRDAKAKKFLNAQKDLSNAQSASNANQTDLITQRDQINADIEKTKKNLSDANNSLDEQRKVRAELQQQILDDEKAYMDKAAEYSALKAEQKQEQESIIFDFDNTSDVQDWDLYNSIKKQIDFTGAKIADEKKVWDELYQEKKAINEELVELGPEQLWASTPEQLQTNARIKELRSLDSAVEAEIYDHNELWRELNNYLLDLYNQLDEARPATSRIGNLDIDISSLSGNKNASAIEQLEQDMQSIRIDKTGKEYKLELFDRKFSDSTVANLQSTLQEQETQLANIEEQLASVEDFSALNAVVEEARDASIAASTAYNNLMQSHTGKEDTTTFDEQLTTLNQAEADALAKLNAANERLGQQVQQPSVDIAAQIQAVLDEIDEIGDASGRLEAYKKAGEAIENKLESASETLVAIGEAEAELQKEQANFEAILEEGALIGDTTSTQEALAQNQAAQDELIARKGEVEQTISNLEAQQGEVNAQIRLTTEAIAGISQQETDLQSKMQNLITIVNGYNSALIEIRHRYDEIPEGKEIVDDLVEIAKAGDLDESALRNYDRFNELLEILGENADISSDKVQELVDTVNHFAGVNLDQKTFAEQINELDALQSAYDKFRQNVENKEVRINLDSSEIENLREKFGNLKTADGMDFDEFELIVGSQTSSAEQIQAAFDGMLTAYAQQKIALDELSDSNAAYVQTQLEMEGATTASAAAFVQAALARANATRIAAEEGFNLSTVTQQDIMDLLQEGIVSQAVAEELALLALQKQIAAEGAFNEASNIDQLIGLANAANVTSDALGLLANAKSLVSGEVTGLGADEVDARLADIKEKLGDISGFKSGHTLDFSKDLKNTAGGAGKAADKTDELKDALSDINKQIDEIQDAYEKLTEIQETFNEYGHITIDQAQELSNMDFRYLAQFSDESGNINATAEAFDALTQAKIQELQVAMIRKAMDLISTFTNEAVAAEYLANSYLTAADAGLTLVSVMQMINDLPLGENGLAAANEVYKGLEAGLKMVGTVDPQLTLSGAGGRDDSDRPGSRESESSDSGKDYEQDFDWIEKLLERLNKLTAKWTDRADRFFTFWNKNWALNKAIKGNQNEQEANQKAYNYYLKEANKVDIDKDYKNRIQNGEMLAEVIDDEELGKKIEEYQKW